MAAVAQAKFRRWANPFNDICYKAVRSSTRKTHFFVATDFREGDSMATMVSKLAVEGPAVKCVFCSATMTKDELAFAIEDKYGMTDVRYQAFHDSVQR